MKTIFITSFHVLISRNIFSTPIPKMLTDRGLRLVVLAPEHKKEYFERNFSGPNIVIEGVKAYVFSSNFADLFFKRLARPLLDTSTTRVRALQKLVVEKRWFYYCLLLLPARLLGKSRLAVRCIRFLDYLLASHRGYFYPLLEKYRPDLVVATDVLNENDVALLQDAKRRGIPSVAILRSWDNLTNMLMRILPQQLIVQNEILKYQALRYHGIPAERIHVAGVPHYDRYIKGPGLSRERFFASMGLDPAKKLILYAPVSDLRVKRNDYDQYISEVLAGLQYNVLVRFPPAGAVTLDKGALPVNVVIDDPGMRFGDRAESELSREDDERLVNGLSYADVVVSGPSTMCIDAAVFDKPVILVDFSLTPKHPLEGIIEYGFEHIQPILKSGGVRLAKSAEELKEYITMYLNNPRLDAEGRRRIVQEQAFRIDGKSSERVAEFILANVTQPI